MPAVGSVGSGNPLNGLTPYHAQGVANALTAGQGGNPLIQAIIGEEAPAIGQYGQQVASGYAGILGAEGNAGAQEALLQQSTGLQGEQLTNQLQGNQLSQQNVSQQLGITNQQYGLQQQLAGIQQGQLNYNLPIAQQLAQSAGAAAGKLGTVGYKEQYGQIGEQYDVSSAELANQLAGETLTNKGQNLSAANQTAQLQNAAAALGISQQQLQNQLAQGTLGTAQQLGQTVDQLGAQIAQGYAGEAQGLGAIYSNIGALTGLGPQQGYSLGSNLGAY